MVDQVDRSNYSYTLVLHHGYIIVEFGNRLVQRLAVHSCTES